MQKVFILGATGSIGNTTLKCIEFLNKNNSKYKFKVTGISFNKNIFEAEKIIQQFKIPTIICNHSKTYALLKSKFPKKKIYLDFLEGLQGQQFDVLVNGLMGSIGLKPTIIGIKKKAKILLANKETLIIAGTIINQLLKKYKAPLIPLDSEHSAIFQLLQKKNITNANLKKIILTASGGPFFKKKIVNPSLVKALKHPNWKMGKKITIDSATMMNKGLEVIEAHYLFKLAYDKIETIIHPESIVHSFIVSSDNSYYAQLGNPDMKHPILNALTYPEIVENQEKLYDLTSKKLSFYKIPRQRFPMIDLAYSVGREGGSLLTVMNAANEAAVNLFLNKKIQFKDIFYLVEKYVSQHRKINHLNVEKIIQLDQEIKEKILDFF